MTNEEIIFTSENQFVIMKSICISIISDDNNILHLIIINNDDNHLNPY